jgi:hypothetical protein
MKPAISFQLSALSKAALLGSLLLAPFSLIPAVAQQLISDLVVQRTEVFSGDLTPTQIAADQDNYNPTSLSTASALRLSTDASRTINGLAGGSDGRRIRLINVGSFNVVLANEGLTSTAANRFALTANLTLEPKQGIELQYDSTSSRWRPIGSPAQTAGTGTVTSFSAGDLSPLFTTSEATATTTPALTFALSTQTANAVLAGPTTGIASAPTFRALVAADVPDLSGTYQLLDSDLTYLAGFTPTANVKSLLNAADYAAVKTLLALTIGTDVQAYHANLAGLAGLTSAADRLAYFSGIGGATSLATLTSYARTILDDVDAGTARTTLGLGTMAVAATADYSATTVINGWLNDPTTNGSFTAGNWRAGLTIPAFASTDPGLTNIFPFWNDTTNLVDYQSAGATRTALGLGGAAVMSVGTSAGTLAAGDDSRITGAAQKASNLSDLSSAATSRTNLGLGTIATQAASNVAITGGTITGVTWQFGNTGLKIEDTNASHLLTIAPGSDLTANRTLTLTTGDAARTLTLSGDPTLGDWFDQSVKTGASPNFVTVTAALSGNATTATTLATTRAIYGNNFNGSAALTQIIAPAYGGASYILPRLAPARIVFEGDSLSDPNGVSPITSTTTWPYYLTNNYAWAGVTNYNQAVAGETVVQMLAEYATEVYPYRPSGGDQVILFIEGGLNDQGGGASPTTIYNNLKTYWAAARADGFTVVAFTVTNTIFMSSTQFAEIITLNKLIRSDPTLYDHLIEWDTIFPSPFDETRYFDGVHLTADANSRLAGEINRALTRNSSTLNSDESARNFPYFFRNFKYLVDGLGGITDLTINDAPLKEKLNVAGSALLSGNDVGYKLNTYYDGFVRYAAAGYAGSVVLGSDGTLYVGLTPTSGAADAVASLSNYLTITKDGVVSLAALSTNGFVKTGGSSGTLSVDTTSYVSQATTVNGHALSGNVTVTTGDLGVTTVGTAAVGQIPGTTTNDDAAAGKVGEHMTATLGYASPVSLTTNTGANVISLSLTAGDWDVSGIVIYVPNSATLLTNIFASISTTTDTIQGYDSGATAIVGYNGTALGGAFTSVATPVYRLSLASTTTVYLVAQSAFTTNTNAAAGTLRARRMR